jgi:large subunit ribosomal protein L35Ae
MSEFPKKGAIIGYRRSKRIIHPNFVIIKFDEIQSRKEAAKLIGKKVIWRSPAGKMKIGYLTRLHGNNGAVVANFKGSSVPGTAFGEKVELKL